MNNCIECNRIISDNKVKCKACNIKIGENNVVDRKV